MKNNDKMKVFTVYVHINKANNKMYVGYTGLNPEKRWNGGNGYSQQPKFYEDILKYGWDNFIHIIIATSLTKEEAMKLEGEIINTNKTYLPEYGYNTHTNGTVDNVKPYVKGKSIRCVETGELFKTFNAAAKSKGLSSGSCISRVLNNPSKTSGKCHWVQD